MKIKFLLMGVILLTSMAIAPQAGGQDVAEFVVVFAMPYDFEEYSQYTAQSYATVQWLSSIQAGLFSRSIDEDRGYVEELADSYEVSDDKKTYTITLKSGLQFSDGTDLTAEDVKFTYESLLTPSINLNSYSFLATYLTSNDSIKVVDDLTVEFTLDTPYAFALGLFTQGIAPKAYFADRLAAGDYDWNKEDLSDTISAGPYVVESFDSTNMEIVVTRNEFYWNADQVASDKIVFTKIAEKAAAISALADGEIDIFDSQYVAGKNELDGVSNKQEDFVAAPSHQELSFNHAHPYIGTGESLAATDKVAGAKAVRKAISTIINRDFAANDILEGLGLPAATIVPSVAIGWDSTLEPREYSIAAAKTLMEAAGFDYADLTADGDSYEDSFFDITVLSPNTNPARNAWSALVAETLPKIGIGVTEHVSTGWAEIIPRTFGSDVEPPVYADGGFDIFFVGYSWDLDVDPTGLFEKAALRPNGGNFYNFENTEYDQLLTAYTTELDLETRITAFKDLQAFMYEWEIVAPIVYPQDHWGYSADLQGWDSILLSTSAAEWDKIGTQDAIDAIGSFLPLDISAFFVGFMAISIAIKYKKRD